MLFSQLRHRLIVIALLIVGSVSALWWNHRKTSAPDRPGQFVNLGLDLQGGMHLALELDQSERASADPARDIERALTILRKRMDEFGVLEPLVQGVGKDRILVELPGLRDPARAKAIVQRSAFLEFRFTDESGALERSLPSMDRALRDLGITLTTSTTAGDRSLAVTQLLSGGDSVATDAAPAQLSQLIVPATQAGFGSMPGEYVVQATRQAAVDIALNRPEVRRLWPRGVDLKWSARAEGDYRFLYALEDKAIITGTSLENATAQNDPLTGAAEVNFELDRLGGREFGRQTGRHVGDYLAIILDGQVQGRPPVIQSRIERQGRIQMAGRSLQEAQDLALTLRAGSLPTPLRIIEDRQVGPSLGEDSIRGGITAGLVGTALVILIVVGYYRLSGVLAIIALSLYTLFTFGVLAMFGASLTLPGLAGFVLSIGMAVDANVLIFERIREELDLGKTSRLAVQEGFRHAMPAIIDSNLTTVLTALFLFQFGTGPVQGFAVTLIIGIVASMVTAVFVTRTLYQIWLSRRSDATPISVGTVRLFQGASHDFLGMRKKAYVVTLAILLAGATLLAIRPMRYGVEFTGGTLHQVQTRAPVDQEALRQSLERKGLAGAELQRFGSPTEYLVRAGGMVDEKGEADLEGAAAAVSAALEETVGKDEYRITRTEAVGPKVGGELRIRAAIAILLSFAAVLVYLAFRFEWRFGLAAVGATAHDILATLAFIRALDLEISLVVVAAILTVVGYSLNDTIVIFDRVRENLRDRPKESLGETLNRSVNETLPRTVLTGGTALATLAALAVFGGEVVRPFALVMFFGIFTGTFSSIFIGSPLLAAIHRRWPARVAGRKPAPVPVGMPAGPASPPGLS